MLIPELPETPPSPEEKTRQFPTPDNRCRIREAPLVEELQQLDAGSILVPTAVRPDDVKELTCGFLASGTGIQGQGVVEACLLVLRIGIELAPKVGQVPELGARWRP